MVPFVSTAGSVYWYYAPQCPVYYVARVYAKGHFFPILESMAALLPVLKRQDCRLLYSKPTESAELFNRKLGFNPDAFAPGFWSCPLTTFESRLFRYYRNRERFTSADLLPDHRQDDEKPHRNE